MCICRKNVNGGIFLYSTNCTPSVRIYCDGMPEVELRNKQGVGDRDHDTRKICRYDHQKRTINQ